MAAASRSCVPTETVNPTGPWASFSSRRAAQGGPPCGKSAEPSTEDDDAGSFSRRAVTIAAHAEAVAQQAVAFATNIGLGPALTNTIAFAARHHDDGKADPRFQAWLSGLVSGEAEPLAKSGRWRGRAAETAAREAASMPPKWRHEVLSVRVAAQLLAAAVAEIDSDLALFLIGSHHGQGRPFFAHHDPWDAAERTVLGVALAPAAGPERLDFDWLGMDWRQLFTTLQSLLRCVGTRPSRSRPASRRPPCLGGKGMTGATHHRLEGLEPDNLLAFLTLLGLLRSLDTARPAWRARAYWDDRVQPLRPLIALAAPEIQGAVAAAAAEGAAALAATYAFDRADLAYQDGRARALLAKAEDRRQVAELMGALMSDGAVRDDERVWPTPLCFLFGQGHQHFLSRLADIPAGRLPSKIARRASRPTSTPRSSSPRRCSPPGRAPTRPTASAGTRWRIGGTPCAPRIPRAIPPGCSTAPTASLRSGSPPCPAPSSAAVARCAS